MNSDPRAKPDQGLFYPFSSAMAFRNVLGEIRPADRVKWVICLWFVTSTVAGYTIVDDPAFFGPLDWWQ